MTPASKLVTLSPSGAAPARRPSASLQLSASESHRAELHATRESDLSSIDNFVAALGDLPLSRWLTIGRGLTADRDGLAARQRAFCVVETAIEAAGLGIVAWYARDAVDTVACLVGRRAARWSRADRCSFAATHGAAEVATLAMLARERIPAEMLETLCAPFATVIDTHSP